MNTETSQLIKEQYNKLPQELKDAVTATDLPLKMKTIANTHGLLIDQLEGLQNEILFVLLGIEPSSSFVDNLTKEIGVDRKKATDIAVDTNKLIFDSIRQYLQKWEAEINEEENTKAEISNDVANQKNSAVSSLEKLGGFSIEQNEGSVSNENTTPVPPQNGNTRISSKDSIIAGIENPVVPTPTRRINLMDTNTSSNMVPVPKSTENHVDPLIDHLLTTAVSMPEQKVQKTMNNALKKVVVPQTPNTSGRDMYREPIN